MTTFREMFSKPLYPVAFLIALGAAHVFFTGLAIVGTTWFKAEQHGMPVDGYLTQFLVGLIGIAVSLVLATAFYRKI